MPEKSPSDTKLNTLLQKYLSGTCSRPEFEELLAFSEKEDLKEELTISMKDQWTNSMPGKPTSREILAEKFLALMQEAKSMDAKKTGKPKVKWMSKITSYAAAILILFMLSAGVYYYFTQTKPNPPLVSNSLETIENTAILPGGNKAILILANGTSITLEDMNNGTLAIQGNTTINQSDGILSYSNENNKNSEMLFNTISTPKGGQYRLILSDGTKVWLNAASTLTYPISFEENERRVELTGEAYFEVASNDKQPFRVFSKELEVEVLGTHFNINAYDNEGDTRTTLLEGSVKIIASGNMQFLKPGQQARVSATNNINVINKVETEEVIAWKNEKFQFIKADIQTVMRQIERWYDVEVEYQGNISTHFGGSISRNVNLDQVLNILQQTEKVRFEVKGKKVLVLPPNLKNK